MNKSIYDEVLEILLDSYIDPLDEDSDCYMLIGKEMKKIRQAILKAQKQEKLLELYKKLSNLYETLYNMELSIDLEKELGLIYDVKILKQRIKELENEK